MARLKELKTGRAIGGDWQVLDGLKAGDKVIVQGLQNLRPDMKVTPMPAQTASAPPAPAAAK
jgi:membrane fusion protein (multidrug efflux system)